MGQLMATLNPKSRHVKWPPSLSRYPSNSTIDDPRTEKTIVTGPGGDASAWRCSKHILTDEAFGMRLPWPYEVRKDNEGRAYVMDHVNLITTWEDPVQKSGISGYLNGWKFDVGQDDIDRAVAVLKRGEETAWSSTSTLNDDETQESPLVTTIDCKTTEEVKVAVRHTSTGM
ncbi:hypothetical protein MMC17_003552 [Xylographa soralifera]|nr:hypothetical protein [Xylographa soralifera]